MIIRSLSVLGNAAMGKRNGLVVAQPVFHADHEYRPHGTEHGLGMAAGVAVLAKVVHFAGEPAIEPVGELREAIGLGGRGEAGEREPADPSLLFQSHFQGGHLTIISCRKNPQSRKRSTGRFGARSIAVPRGPANTARCFWPKCWRHCNRGRGKSSSIARSASPGIPWNS